jgi:hypothetical protein
MNTKQGEIRLLAATPHRDSVLFNLTELVPLLHLGLSFQAK